jgi:hypothetical protein
MQMLPSQTVSFWEVHVLHLLRCIGLLGAKWSFLHFESYDLQDVSLSKSNASLTRKQSGRFLASNTDFVLSRYTHVSSTYLNWPICKKMRLSPPWKVSIAGVILPKPIGSLTGKQCGWNFCFYLDDFLSRNACVSSTELTRPICNTMSLSPAWKLWLAACIPVKN